MAKLKYAWQDNAATQDDPNDYYPRVVDLEYKTQDDLIKDIAVPGSILKDTELRAVDRRIHQQIATIETTYDRKSDTTNDKLTPGHSVKITGSQLKIYDRPAGQGLFFVSRADNKEYPTELEENYPTQLPDDLPAGEYTLKIVNTKQHNSTTLRTTLSEIVLTVE